MQASTPLRIPCRTVGLSAWPVCTMSHRAPGRPSAQSAMLSIGSILRVFGQGSRAAPWDARSRSAPSSSASSGSSSTPRASPPRSPSRRAARGAAARCARLERQRPRPARGVSRDRRRDPRGARDHAGGRVAGRQLPPRRGADPRDPRRPAARLLPRSCRSSPTGRSRATRASSASPGRSSRTPTAASIPRRCAASCAPTSACSR